VQAEIGRDVLSAMAAALREQPATPALQRVAALVAQYEAGKFDHRELRKRLLNRQGD